MTTTTITPTMTTGAAVRALFTLLVLLCRRAGAAAVRAVRAVRHWLNSRHDFGDREDEIILTGWQYLGVGALSGLVCVLLSIEY